jgi:hypothetical protein
VVSPEGKRTVFSLEDPLDRVLDLSPGVLLTLQEEIAGIRQIGGVRSQFGSGVPMRRPKLSPNQRRGLRGTAKERRVGVVGDADELGPGGTLGHVLS